MIPPLLVELEQALGPFGARVITGDEATHNGVPKNPKQRETYLVFEHNGYCYAVCVPRKWMPFCNLSVRRVEEQEWPVTHFVTRDVDTILERIRELENPPPPTPKKKRRGRG